MWSSKNKKKREIFRSHPDLLEQIYLQFIKSQYHKLPEAWIMQWRCFSQSSTFPWRTANRLCLKQATKLSGALVQPKVSVPRGFQCARLCTLPTLSYYSELSFPHTTGFPQPLQSLVDHRFQDPKT